LPFGLRNVRSIFQRALDDVLREQIGKICYVYVDDVIIFSENEFDHVRHIDTVLKCLIDANMRVSQEKSRFFEESVEYLGFILSKDGTKSDPEKVRAIQEYSEPDSVYKVRSFLDTIWRRKKTFYISHEALPFNTAGTATIRTVDNEPVYSRAYLNPMGVSDFVNNEIKQLLNDGIIRPSRSPYNSPTWVADKKGTDAFGNPKKRLVIDFRNLNERTIPDRYPMPSIPMILANLARQNSLLPLILSQGNTKYTLRRMTVKRRRSGLMGANTNFAVCRSA